MAFRSRLSYVNRRYARWLVRFRILSSALFSAALTQPRGLELKYHHGQAR